MEPVLLLGKHRFEAVDIRIRVKGGGNVSQIYGELPQCTVSPSAAGLTLQWPSIASRCTPSARCILSGKPSLSLHESGSLMW